MSVSQITFEVARMSPWAKSLAVWIVMDVVLFALAWRAARRKG